MRTPAKPAQRNLDASDAPEHDAAWFLPVRHTDGLVRLALLPGQVFASSGEHAVIANRRIVASYDDAYPVRIAGPVQIVAVGTVTPRGREWQVDLRSLGGPLLGPFKTRAEAEHTRQRWVWDN